jgi:uncharacterized protein
VNLEVVEPLVQLFSSYFSTLHDRDLGVAAFGFAAGLMIYVSGVVVPTLVGVFGLDAAVAVGPASLFSVLFKSAAGLGHGLSGNLALPLLRRFLARSIPTCLLAALLLAWVTCALPGQAELLDGTLKLMCLVVGAFALSSLFVKRFRVAMYRLGFSRLAWITGSIVGATGTGGGVLVVPALMAGGTETIHRVVGTSVLVWLALSAVTSLVLSSAGVVSYRTVVLMTVGAALSIPLAWVSTRHATASVIKCITLILGSMALLSLMAQLARW